jgi:hypothetical protein
MAHKLWKIHSHFAPQNVGFQKMPLPDELTDEGSPQCKSTEVRNDSERQIRRHLWLISGKRIFEN